MQQKQKHVVLGLLVKRCNNILLCVIWLDRKYCRWNCATARLESIHKVHLHREFHKTSFVVVFSVTAKNLIWPVVFLIFCSWWPAEEYLSAAMRIMILRCKMTMNERFNMIGLMTVVMESSVTHYSLHQIL